MFAQALSHRMAVPYVCFQCSRRATVRAAGLVKKQRAAYASSSSVGDTFHETLSTLSQSVPKHDVQMPSRVSRPPDRQSRQPRIVTNDRRMQPEELMSYLSTPDSNRPGRYSRPESAPETHSTSTSKRRVPGADPRHIYAVTKLETLLDSGRAQEAWHIFLEHFEFRDSPVKLKPSFRDMAVGGKSVVPSRLFHKLIHQICQAWLQPLKDGSEPVNVPSPEQVLDKMRDTGIATREMQGQLMWVLAVTLELPVSKGKDVFNSSPLAVQAFDLLMRLWSHWFSQGSSSITQVSGGSESWSFIPENPKSAFARPSDAPKELTAFFLRFVTPFGNEGTRGSNASLATALLTYDLLTYGAVVGNGLPKHFERYQPFVESLKRILLAASLDSASASRLENRLKAADIDEQATKALLGRLGQQPLRAVGKAIVNPAMVESNHLDERLIQIADDVDRAIERQNLDWLETLWKQGSKLVNSPQAKESDSANVLRLYEHFLRAYLRLRQPKSALDVWNVMVQNKCEPTVRTWTVFMKGTQISRNYKVIEELWQRMRRSGIQPDIHAWSTRVFGLLRCNHHQDGIRALREMGREWKAAAQARSKGKIDISTLGDVDGVPKPNTAILNSAVSALASQGSQMIDQVVEWGRSFGIEPDLITYNALINVSLAKSRPEEALQLLKRMSASGVKPDSATLTVLLTSLFRTPFLAELSPTEQQARVISLIDGTEFDGLQPDDKGYALIIDRLIKQYSNLSAAQAVLAHMASRNIEPTPHIYTILMTYYFQLSPPDLHAAEALWNQIGAKNNNYGTALDVIFYDRMVEGYARHGDVGRMLAFLGRMSKQGKRPGWPAMMAVVQSLADRGDWDRVREIVLDCRRASGMLSPGLRGTKGETQFWELVRDLGVFGVVNGPEATA